MERVEIYTDGACRGNPGPGGYGAVLLWRGEEKVMNGFEAETTNNRMELLAAIMALEGLKRPMSVALYTDSRYVKDGIEKWLAQWERNGWRTSNRSPVKNRDLWERLKNATERHDIIWHWVKGHSHNKYNERADALARQAIDDNV